MRGRRTNYDWLLAAALVVAVFLVYQPAWQGGFIWDDEAHVTRPDLRSWQGLCRIWFEPGATQQYYPLLYSAFWVEHRLWGDAALGYHLVNLFLHAAAAILVALTLRRLAIPGAFLAAAIFALHPIHVESVAWITEQKNTLSAVFYLSAMLAYLRFDRTREPWSYTKAFALFVLAVLSKTTTVTLPAALLVIFWWQRGKLSWRRDVLPLLPWLIVGLAAGAFVAWVERRYVGAEGALFAFSVGQRCWITGRGIWFYLGQLFWPVELIFIYPRWNPETAGPWPYLFPAGVLLLLGLAWSVRRRWRAPLAGLLFFIGTLLPVAGVFNAWVFVYSFVADHFLYLPSLGIIVLVAAGLATLAARTTAWRRWAVAGFCFALLAGLATLTWRQSRMYTDIETLYETTIQRNPACWMAQINLGRVLEQRGLSDAAMRHYQRALDIKPDCAEAHGNLGNVLASCGRIDEATAHLQTALKIKPDNAQAHYNLAVVLAGRGRIDEAIAEYQEAVKIDPHYAAFHNNLGTALAQRGRLDEAIAQFQQALDIRPDYAEAHYNLGLVLARCGRLDEAMAQYQTALDIEPGHAKAHNNLGTALAQRGRLDEAIAQFQKSLEIKPDSADVHYNLGTALAGAARMDEAIGHYRQALVLAQRQNNAALAEAAKAAIAQAAGE